MQIASDVSRRITLDIPKTVTALEGQAVDRNGNLLTSGSVAGLSDFAVGIVMIDTPAFEAYNPSRTCLPVNVSRCTPVATQGLIPVRVQDLASYTALVVGGRFSFAAGNAVAPTANVAAIGAVANVLTIKAKARAASGSYFVLVEVQ